MMTIMNDRPQSVAPRGTGLDFVHHWDWVAKQGLMPRNTAMSIRAAASQVLKLEQEWESVDVRQLDVDGLLMRFRNVSRLSPTSLATYESRFRSGLESYLAYLDNPTTYRPKGRRTVRSSSERAIAVEASRPAAHVTSPVSSSPVIAGGARLVVYPFPVRADLFAELKLPADLTLTEARRMGRFLETIAISDDDHGDGEA